MTLLKIQALSDNAEFVNAFAGHIAKHDKHVCSVCKLGVMGHAPESKWLGYSTHEFSPMHASQELLDNAARLTGQAYRNRCALELCGAYCVNTHKAISDN